jgi:predicted CXXCH cytochrome family protein
MNMGEPTSTLELESSGTGGPSDALGRKGIRKSTFRLGIGVLLLALMLAVLLSMSIGGADVDDGETRSATDPSYMDTAEYVGSSECEDCHSDEYDIWADSFHPKKIQVADDTTIISDWTGDAVVPIADGLDATITLIKNESGYFVDLDGNGTVYKVDFTLGGSGWKQRYVTTIGNSLYILPHQWNVVGGGWVAYHASDWYDTTTGEAKLIAISQSWDRRCAGCHATGVELGFNDTSGEWTATYTELGIGCEGCHGPGSLHIDPPDGEDQEDYIWNPLDSTVCGNCHNRGASVGQVGGKTTGYPMNAAGEVIMPGDDHDDFFVRAPGYHADGETSSKHRQQYIDYITHPHSDSLATLQASTDADDSCLECHSTDYRLAEAGSEPDLTTAVNSIECGACHDSHGSANEHDLRLPPDEICTQCHSAGGTAPGERAHNPQKEILEGDVAIAGIAKMPWMNGDVTCVDCHMPKVAKSAELDIASHSFYFISPQKSIDHGMPNSCNVACHADGSPEGLMTDQEALDHINEWVSETTAMIAATEGNVTAAEAAIAAAEALGFSTAVFDANNDTFNDAALAFAIVESDGSMAHNHEFKEALLDFAQEKSDNVVAALTPGTISGKVLDGDKKAVSGAEIRIGDDVWATTGADGSFSFDIAPGDYSFDVYKGTKKEKSFSADGVTASETTDVGDIKFKKKDDGPGFGLVIAATAMLLSALFWSNRRRA